MQRFLLIIIALILVNTANATNRTKATNCDNLLKKWAIIHNSGKKIEAKKIFKIINKQCISK